ncbi:unnamed protein product [Closterium sp. NIES-54]
MAAQELRWLTYLLTDLGEQPRSSPVLSPALSSTSYPASDETAAVSTTSGRPRSKGGKRRRKGGGAGGGLGGGAGTGVSSASGGGDTGGGTGLAAPTRGVAGVAAWYTAQLRQQSHQK